MNAVRLAKEKSPSVSTEASGWSETPATAWPPVLSVAVNWARPLRCPGSPGGGRQGALLPLPSSRASAGFEPLPVLWLLDPRCAHLLESVSRPPHRLCRAPRLSPAALPVGRAEPGRRCWHEPPSRAPAAGLFPRSRRPRPVASRGGGGLTPADSARGWMAAAPRRTPLSPLTPPAPEVAAAALHAGSRGGAGPLPRRTLGASPRRAGRGCLDSNARREAAGRRRRRSARRGGAAP